MPTKEKMSVITVRVSSQEREAIEKFCAENDLSMSQVIRKALKDFFKDKEQ